LIAFSIPSPNYCDMEAETVPTLDVLGKLLNAEGHSLVYWLAGARLGGAYNL
jgi:hypothetical protein